MINVLWVIAWRDLLAQLRSRSFLVQTLLLPFILTLLIGNAIGGTRKADPLPVAVVGTGEIAKSIGGLLEDSKIAKVLGCQTRQVPKMQCEQGKQLWQ